VADIATNKKYIEEVEDTDTVAVIETAEEKRK
jgi:hypothetical protein